MLAELEDRIGLLPAGHGVPEKFARLAGPERRTYALAASYHTAYVMGMLCALLLRGDDLPTDAASGADAALAVTLLHRLPDGDAPWRTTLAGLPPETLAPLTGWLLDLALLAAARAHDFAAVGSLLAQAAAAGEAGRPLCAQAVQLLERSAAAAAMTGGSVSAAA